MAKRTSLRISKPSPKPKPLIQSTPAPQQPTGTTQIQRAVDNPTPETLTPDVIQSLQRTHGNQAVQRLIQRANMSSTTTIQRAGRMRRIGESIEDDPGVLDTIGTFGDYLGTDPTQGLGSNLTGQNTGTGNSATGLGQQTGGNVISVVTGTLGTGINIYGLQKNIRGWHKASKDLKTKKTAYKGPSGDKELYATVELLKRKRSAARKGTAESSGGILGGISGFINGVAGFFTSAAAGATAGVAFAAGAGLSALVGTINAFRDFFNVHKRRKGQKSIQNVINSYVSIATPLAATVTQKKADYTQAVTDGEKLQQDKNQFQQDEQALQQEKTKIAGMTQQISDYVKSKPSLSQQDRAKLVPILQQLRDKKSENDQALQTLNQKQTDNDQEILTNTNKIQDISNQVRDAEQKFDGIDKMRVALATSKRKTGYKGKIVGGLTNLTSAAGGAALLAATVGAGAAAGPVGWVLAGVALVAALSFFIGMHVKRKIRKSNVTRMNAELLLVDEYINGGTITGTAVPGAGTTVDERKQDTWNRDMFTGKGTGTNQVKAKGWFNKLISKKKSGTLNMGARKAELEAYLAKYDKGQAGDTIFEGFKQALKAGDEGDQMVDNPKHNPQKPDPNIPPQITLRKSIEDLLKHFFGSKSDEMKQSILSTDTQKSAAAKSLLLQKMKLESK